MEVLWRGKLGGLTALIIRFFATAGWGNLIWGTFGKFLGVYWNRLDWFLNSPVYTRKRPLEGLSFRSHEGFQGFVESSPFEGIIGGTFPGDS